MEQLSTTERIYQRETLAPESSAPPSRTLQCMAMESVAAIKKSRKLRKEGFGALMREF